MDRKYVINLFDPNSYDKAIKNLVKLGDKLQSKDFMNFIADKCLIEVDRITNQALNSTPEEAVEDASKYRGNHKVRVANDYVIVFNKTMADLSNLSEKTLANYPHGFSISKAIEFGTGILGTNNEEFEWITQMNPNRNYDKGWYYERDGKLHWTRGMEGKFIYYQLAQAVKKNFDSWLNEYIDKI